MTAAVLTNELTRKSVADGALDVAARFWFLVAVLGQWTFVYYIASVYVVPTVMGYSGPWRSNDSLIKGYIVGDHVGNLYFTAHVFIAALITTSGALQLVPQIRARAISFHRWNGRVYISAAFLMALGGLWLVWVRGTFLTVYSAASSTLLAILIMVCATMTVRHALARRIDLHHRWALRTFMVVNGVWFQRIGYMFWTILNQGPAGMGKHMDGPFDIFWGFGCYLLPLAVLEIYLRTRDQADSRGKAVMATALFAVTVAMGVGIFGAYMFMWRPFITF